jgi:uncharacterized protein (TIGR02271 family)
MAEQEQVAAIPLVEERLSVDKRAVETGRFKVRINVDEREEVVTQELARDAVDIERVPMNVPVSELPNVRLEGGTTIIPVVEEVLVVEKRLMLVEEIHVRRSSTSEMHEIPVTVRSERAEVEHQLAGAAPHASAADHVTTNQE